MLNIAICDDDKIFAKVFGKDVKQCFSEIELPCSVRIFVSANDFLESLANEFFDLIFLDIEIGNSSGIDIAEIVRNEHKNLKSFIVFISSHSGYHYSGKLYEASPIQFLSKPIEPESISKVAEIISKRILSPPATEDYFVCSFRSNKKLILKRDIFYFESELRYMVVATESERIKFNASMKNVRKQISDSSFVQIHRSFLVNLAHVKEYDAQNITMKNGDFLRISSGYKQGVLAAIMDYMEMRGLNRDL